MRIGANVFGLVLLVYKVLCEIWQYDLIITGFRLQASGFTAVGRGGTALGRLSTKSKGGPGAGRQLKAVEVY